jgi:hypothetical protein
MLREQVRLQYPFRNIGGSRAKGYCTVRLFLFSWLKRQLERREYNGENKLFEVPDEILTGLSVQMIETVFVDWMNRLQRLPDGNGDYVS